jgi:hypothetical protein
MARSFDVVLPFEQAYLRKVLFAVEVLDAVTLGRVSQGLKLAAKGLKGEPIVNTGGLFVWLKEGNSQPLEVRVDAGSTPFEGRTVPVGALPDRLLRIELAPRRAYPFAPGVTGVKGTLVARRNDHPPVPVAGATVWLRWIDDNANGTTWMDAPTRSTTSPKGDFVAILRLSPAQLPRLDAAGPVRLRLAADRGPLGTLASPEMALPQGRVASAQSTFAWDEFSQP